jgi:hypothetical protein
MNKIFKVQKQSKKNFMKVLRTYIKMNKTAKNKHKNNEIFKNNIIKQ